MTKRQFDLSRCSKTFALTCPPPPLSLIAKPRAHQVDAVDFFNMLTGPQLLEITEAHLPEHRERLYPPTVALSMFMKQNLQADRSCQRL